MDASQSHASSTRDGQRALRRRVLDFAEPVEVQRTGELGLRVNLFPDAQQGSPNPELLGGAHLSLMILQNGLPVLGLHRESCDPLTSRDVLAGLGYPDLVRGDHTIPVGMVEVQKDHATEFVGDRFEVRTPPRIWSHLQPYLSGSRRSEQGHGVLRFEVAPPLPQTPEHVLVVTEFGGRDKVGRDLYVEVRDQGLPDDRSSSTPDGSFISINGAKMRFDPSGRLTERSGQLASDIPQPTRERPQLVATALLDALVGAAFKEQPIDLAQALQFT